MSTTEKISENSVDKFQAFIAHPINANIALVENDLFLAENKKDPLIQLFKETQIEKTQSNTGLTKSAKKRAARIKAKAASASENSLVEKKTELDASKIFYKLYLQDREGESIVLGIPLNILSQGFQQTYLKNSTTPEYDSMDPKERLSAWKKVFNVTKAYEITSLEAKRIIGLTPIEFTRRYGSSLKVKIEESFENKFTKKTTQMFKEGPEGGLKIEHNNKYESHFNPLEMLDAGLQRKKHCARFIDQFKNNLRQVINRYGVQLCPAEPIKTVWDSLSLLILLKQNFNDETTQELTIKLLNFWTDVTYRIGVGSNSCMTHNFDAAKEHFNAAIEQIKNLKKIFQGNQQVNSSAFISEMKDMSWPLLSLLKSWNNDLQEDRLKEEFAIQFAGFFWKTVEALGDRKVNLDPERKIILRWLQTKSTLIAFYQESQKAHLPQDQLEESYKLVKCIANQNWREAYSILHNSIPYSLGCNSNFKIVNNLTTGKEQIVSVLPKEVFLINRKKTLEGSFQTDFEFFIKEGYLFNIISEVAFEQIQLSLTHFNSDVPKAEVSGQKLINWARNLKEQGESELWISLKLLILKWKTLKSAREEVAKPEFINALTDLIQVIKSENYEHLARKYTCVSKSMDNFLPTWMNGLRELNEAIEVVQKLSFIMLADPSLTKFPIDDLKADFRSFNQRIGAFIKPVNTFLNAFQQLISLDKKTFENEGLTLKIDAESLALTLFSEIEEEFAALQASMDEQDPGLEAIELEFSEIKNEEHEVEIEKHDVENNEEALVCEGLADEIKKVFSATKTRKTWSAFSQLLKEKNIPIQKAFGKGDHIKFYLNGKLIVMPAHKEWKPGTAKSIQNAFLADLQDALSRKK